MNVYFYRNNITTQSDDFGETKKLQDEQVIFNFTAAVPNIVSNDVADKKNESQFYEFLERFSKNIFKTSLEFEQIKKA